MLILMIRSDQPTAELYLYADDTMLLKHSWNAERSLAETINREIEHLLTKAQKTLTQIEGICVYSGPGGFTSLRIGHAVANAMSYGLKLPIVESKGSDWQTAGIKMLRNGKDDHLVTPLYGAPARTTKPRK